MNMAREIVFLAMLMLLVATALNGCGLSEAKTSAGTASRLAVETAKLDLIVFSSNRGGQWAIWSMKPDGSRMKQLTKPAEGENDVDAVMSPDGAGILFTSTRGGATGLWRMGIDCAHPERICDGDQGEWSGDGHAIVFRRAGRLFVRELAGGKEKPKTGVKEVVMLQCSSVAGENFMLTADIARVEGAAQP